MSSTRRKLGIGKFPIVTRKNGSLKFHIENLATVQTKATNLQKYKLIPVAIFCPKVSKPEVFSNVLLHYLRFQKEWLVDEKLYSEIGKDNHFMFNDSDPSGIYGYPSLYTLNQRDYSILLHIHFNQMDPRRGKDPLENLLLLFCSRIVEINLSNSGFSIFESVNNLSTSNLPKHLCRDIALVTRGLQGDNLPPNEEKYNLDGFQKINFIFVKMEWATFSTNFRQKSMPPEMKLFIENIVHGMVSDFSLGNTTPLLGELLLYFKKCFDSLSHAIPKNPTKRNISVVPNMNENNILEKIVEALFTPMRNTIVEGLQNGNSDLYNNLVSGSFEVDQMTILRRCQHIIVALKLSNGSIQNFQRISQEKFQVESSQLSLLAKVLKLIHDGIVDDILKVENLRGNVIEEMVNQALNEESCSPFIEKIARILPQFFKYEKNRQLITNWAIFQKCVVGTKRRYDTTLQVALSEQSYSSNIFNATHVKMSEKYIAALETVLVYLSHKMGSVVFQISNKEKFFREEYLTNREYNMDNLESHCKTIKHFVKGIKGQYDLQMQKDLKSNTAITSEDLEDLHQSALSKAETNFAKNIKTSKFSPEDFNEHVKSLRYRIYQAFEGYKVRHARFVSTPPPTAVNVETSNQPASLLVETTNEPSIPAPELKPAVLAIQFTLNKLICKIIFDGNVESSEFDVSVDLAVVLLEDGRLLFGDNYEEFTVKNVTFPEKSKAYKISDCFQSNLGDWSEIAEIGNSKRKINEVFLLGLILLDLKTKIELKYRASIEKVVAAMPNWLATINRSKLKAAFSVAGFEKVDCMSEIFAVACSTLQSSVADESNLLVLSENSNIVEIGRFSSNNSNQFQMEFYDSFCSSEGENVKSGLESILGNMFSKTQHMNVAITCENSGWKTTMENVIPTVHRSNIVFGKVLSGAMNYCKNENMELRGSHDSSKIIVFGELQDGKLKEAGVETDNNGHVVLVSRMKQRSCIKYYEQRTSHIFLIGTLILQKPKSSREVISYFKLENGELTLTRVESRKTANVCELCNKSASSVNSKVIDDACFNFYPVIGEIYEEMGDFIRELIPKKPENVGSNAKDKLRVKCVFLKSAFDDGEIKFKSTLAQKLFLREIDEAGKLVHQSNPSLDEIKKREEVLHKFEAKYLNNKK